MQTFKDLYQTVLKISNDTVKKSNHPFSIHIFPVSIENKMSKQLKHSRSAFLSQTIKFEYIAHQNNIRTSFYVQRMVAKNR